MNFRLCTAFAAALFLLPFASRPAAAQYTVTDLGSNSYPYALNNQGQILSSAYDASNQKGGLYLITGSNRELVSANYVNAYLNNAGQVVFSEGNYPGPYTVVLYANGTRTVLSTNGYAAGLSDSGNVLWNSNGHGFLYSNGVTQDLGAYTAAYVNNSGQVIGKTIGTHGSDAIYVYQSGQWSLVSDAMPYSTRDYFTGQIYTGYQGVYPDALTNSGKVFIITQTLFHAAPSVYVYDIANATLATLISYDIGIGYYYGVIDNFFSNQRGDYGASYLTNFYGPGRSDFASIVINGNVSDPLAGLTRPLGYNSGPFCRFYSLNNRGQCVYSISSSINDADILYDGMTGTAINLDTLFALPAYSSNGSWIINDAAQIAYTAHSDGVSHLYLATPSGTVSGKVTLEGVAANAPKQNLTFTFRDATDYPLFTRTANVGPNGTYSITGIAAGTYHVRVKGDKYLAQRVNITSTGGAVTGADVFLPAGDGNNDNVVDIADFGMLVNAYGGSANVAGSGYDANADFNGDGTVDISDFGLLVTNYDSTGAM